MLDGGDHEGTNILGGDAARGGDVSHGLPVATVERERDTHPLAVVASNLQRLRAPAGIGPINRDAAIMAPLLAFAAMGLEQKAVNLHHAVDALQLGAARLKGSST